MGGTPGAAKTRVWYRKSLCTRVPPEPGEAEDELWELWPDTNPPGQPCQGVWGAAPHPITPARHGSLSAPSSCLSIPSLIPSWEPRSSAPPFLGSSQEQTATRPRSIHPTVLNAGENAHLGKDPEGEPGLGCSGRVDAGGAPPVALLHKAPGACISGSSSRREEK